MTSNHIRLIGRPQTAIRGAQAGFTLVELMVAIVISMLIMLALIAVFVNLTRSNSEMAKTNIQIENGRFAMQLLQEDIVHGGFWGGYVPQFDDQTSYEDPTATDALVAGTVPAEVPDPCLDYDPVTWTPRHVGNLLGISIQSYDTVPTGCAAVVTNQQPNTDVLVVRHAETCVPGIGNCAGVEAGALYFQVSQCTEEINAGMHYALDTEPANLTLKQRSCTGTPPATIGTAAEIRKFVSNLYYIRNFAVTAGDGIPTLVRSQFDLGSAAAPGHQEAVALIEGIEGFRVELGIDSVSDAGLATDYTEKVAWSDPELLISPTNRGDGIPDGAFVRCTGAMSCPVAQLIDVTAVKLYLVARTREVTPGYTDNKTYTLGSTTWAPPTGTANYKRHVFSSSVRLVNVAGRRETP